MNTLITNNQTTNFYNHITKLLQECESFIFNVAFINFSGIQLLLDSFEVLEKRNIKGKILTSTYLNFTQIKALEKIKEFKNIELKIYDSNASNIGFHSKSYIFEFKDNYKILIGSSNITASAFKSNIEWNVKTITKKDDVFLQDVLNEFENLWLDSYEANDEFLKEYADFLDKQKKEFIPEFTYKKSIKTNFMQEKALEKLEELRVKKEKKALVIAATGSGKTYLSAFDVKSFKAKKMLFLVHRENILISAKQSFENIIPNKTFGLFTGNKKEKKVAEEVTEVEVKKPVKELKPKKDAKDSDPDIIDLIEDIKSSFMINNLKWEHRDLNTTDFTWEYIQNGARVKLEYETTYAIIKNKRRLSVNGKEVSLALVSDYLIEEFANYFKDQEREERRKRNSDIIGVAIKSRIDAQKYNM